MDRQNTTASPTNGASTPHDLFVLTDEQILEIEPEGEVNAAPGFSPASSPPRVQANGPAVISSEARNPSSSEQPGQVLQSKRDSSVASLSRNDGALAEFPDRVATNHESQATSHESPVTSHGSPQPPPWLAAQMKDPWTGADATQFWNSVQQARQEAAAYRAAFATPEDARALKELYPGGLNEARTTAQRARILDDIDRAYFGAPGNSPEQLSAARAQLAATRLREDPAAFREMVFAGLRALEDAGVAAPFRAPSSVAEGRPQQDHGGLKPAATQVLHEPPVTSHESLASAYAAFEKAANEDLARSVGAAIERTLQQALPNLQRRGESALAGARQGVPLQDRLTAAVRQDVEAALKGDRQLGEQIAQILSARRFDSETRAQVVRLIDDRARQLVPGAAKRVISDWTQATVAAHRSSTERADVASRPHIEHALAPGNLARGNVAQGESPSPAAFSPRPNAAAFSSRAAQARPGAEEHRNAPRSDARRLDYRKLSDEQILEL